MIKVKLKILKWENVKLKGLVLHFDLIKITLLNLPIYFLSFFLFPILGNVAKHIEKLHREFLLSRLGEKSKFHSINWTKICAPLQNEGLTIKI